MCVQNIIKRSKKEQLRDKEQLGTSYKINQTEFFSNSDILDWGVDMCIKVLIIRV